MDTKDKRIQGAFGYSGISYDTTAKQPLDARMLVPTYQALIESENWRITLPDGSTGTLAYNGMIVAVADKDNEANNGIYMLLDYDKTHKNPITTTHENWHKLANLDELDSYVKNDADFAALKQNVSSNTSAIAALLGDDNNPITSVRGIIQDEITTQISDKTSDLGALVLDIDKNTAAIKALQDNTLTVDSLASELSNFGVNTFVQDSDEIVALTSPGDSRKLGIKGLDISKLVQSPSGIQVILNGGSAVNNEHGYN